METSLYNYIYLYIAIKRYWSSTILYFLSCCELEHVYIHRTIDYIGCNQSTFNWTPWHAYWVSNVRLYYSIVTSRLERITRLWKAFNDCFCRAILQGMAKIGQFLSCIANVPAAVYGHTHCMIAFLTIANCTQSMGNCVYMHAYVLYTWAPPPPLILFTLLILGEIE